MLAQFQSSYRRVEEALDRLTQSIANYNPSTAAADELVAADEAVSADLEQLAIHHANHARIQQLRQTANSLDETIKSTIRVLADTRKEVLAIPSSGSSESRREVQVDELLSYAKFISKTTVPPTFRKPLADDLAPKAASTDNAKTEISNGIATPAQPAAQNTQPAKNVGLTNLNQETKDWLDPLSKLEFVPWPSHDVIQAGALADIQRMREAGKDPASVLSAEEQAAEDQRKKKEEEEERRQQEERERRRMSRFGEGGHGQRRRGEDVFDPDEA